MLYRTEDPARWGVGKCVNLTPAELDGNFWELAERLVSVEARQARRRTASPTPRSSARRWRSGSRTAPRAGLTHRRQPDQGRLRLLPPTALHARDLPRGRARRLGCRRRPDVCAGGGMSFRFAWAEPTRPASARSTRARTRRSSPSGSSTARGTFRPSRSPPQPAEIVRLSDYVKKPNYC